jgi:hypothetical protein
MFFPPTSLYIGPLALLFNNVIVQYSHTSSPTRPIKPLCILECYQYHVQVIIPAMPIRPDNGDDIDSFYGGASGSIDSEALKRAIDIALSQAKAVPLEDVLKSWEEKNPLNTMSRRFEFFISGPMTEHREGLKHMPTEDELSMFRRSNTTRGQDAEYLGKALKNEDVKRAGAINQAYILDIKLLSAKNSYPVPLKLKLTGLRGNLYTAMSGDGARALYTLNACDHNESYGSSEFAPLLHKIPVNADMAEAFALDAVKIEDLDREVTKMETHPDLRIVTGGLSSNICKILADSKNLDALKQVQFNPDDTFIQSLQHVGPVMVVSAKAVEMCKNGLKRLKAEHAKHIPRTDLTCFGAEFVVASKKEHITMQNIELHENFHGKSPDEVASLLGDGLRECRVTLAINYVLKDDVLEKKLRQRD